MKLSIRAIESYLPNAAIESNDLEARIGIAKGWMEKNTGVKTRHWASPHETVASMAATALQKALTAAEMNPDDLDMLIYAGASYDYPIPHNAGLIKKALGIEARFPCFDVDATCLSFLNALDIAHLYFQRPGVETIALVSAELASRALNPQDPKTYSLFGDASVALILQKNGEKLCYEPVAPYFINYAAGATLATVPVGGSVNRGLNPDTAVESFYFKMDGRRLITMTFQELPPFIARYEQMTGTPIRDYDYIIPHQASRFGNDFFMRQYQLHDAQMIQTLAEYGNCISASIPLGISSLVHQIQRLSGKNILLIGSAAGLSLGAMTLKF